MARISSVTASAQRLDAQHAPGERRPGLRAQDDPGRQPGAQAGCARSWSKRTLIHRLAGIDHLDHRLPGHDRGAGIGIARDHQAVDRRHSCRLARCRISAVAVGADARQLLARGVAIGAGRGERRLGHLALLLLGLDRLAR